MSGHAILLSDVVFLASPCDQIDRFTVSQWVGNWLAHKFDMLTETTERRLGFPLLRIDSSDHLAFKETVVFSGHPHLQALRFSVPIFHQNFGSEHSGQS